MLNSLEDVWNKWEIRVLVIVSLFIQVLLLLCAGRRKRIIAFRWSDGINFTWLGPIALYFHWLLWLAYLSADSVAIFALGYLSQYEDKEQNKQGHLFMFWAPFLLLHLGGQDTITALSIEDNELWTRHLLTLVYQVGLAIYVYCKSNLSSAGLLPAAILMFIAGIVKYGERTLSLWRASMSSLRSSMITKPDPGPNYAKFMDEYRAIQAAGLHVEITVVDEHRKDPSLDLNETTKSSQSPDDTGYPQLVFKACQFFETFKRLFVDLILSFEDRKESQAFFNKLPTDKASKAYKVIELELSLMYELLHSKSPVIHTKYGWIFRLITLGCTSGALYCFHLSDQRDHGRIQREHGRIERILTYMLLGGAVGLEIVAIVCLLLSFWTYAALKKTQKWSRIADLLFAIMKLFRPEKESRWSNKMAQYSLITYVLRDKPGNWKKILKCIGVSGSWDNYRYTTYVKVREDIKKLVFEELKNKMKYIVDFTSYRNFSNHKGQWALRRWGYYQELGWSVETEFDESILLWHIATDLLCHSKKAESNIKWKVISQQISNYMLFILVVRPLMLPPGIGQIRFGDTCAEAKIVFEGGEDLDEEKAANMILRVDTKYEPRHVKGDRSKSVLFDGCKLAHELEKEFLKDENPDLKKKNIDRMWKLISVVWVEMLCYAASKCRGQFHAKQLSMGGELLTVVWFLMAHLGMGDHYRIEAGHARAKLFVKK